MICCIIILFSLHGIKAQQNFEVAIISDAGEQEKHFFESNIKAEITALLASQYKLKFTEVYTNGEVKNIKNEIAKVYAQDQAEVLIGSGIISSKLLADQKTYPIPTIASIQLIDNRNTNTASGISNFTYINSPFNINEGFKVLKEICRCKKLAVLSDSNLSAIGIKGEDFYSDKDLEIDWLSLELDLNKSLSNIPDNIEGVYILSPLSKYTPSEIELFFNQLNERKLPTFTLMDAPMLKLGAYASFASSDNLKKIPRRIAMNMERIVEGQDLKEFPVTIESFSNQLVVNMQTANKVGKYPNWTLLDNALLTNINKPHTTRVLNLKSVIAEGIQNNLGYQIETKETQKSKKDIALAKSNYLPALDVKTTGLVVDENSKNSSLGSLGDFNWTAGASFSQLILSEPALANIAIQKLLFESQREVQKQSELDVILEVVQRYFNYKQVQSIAELQNDNIKAVHQNLTIATNKEEVGYSGASDVYRWQIELDLAKTDLYQTKAQLKSVGFQLNETLNRPIGEVFMIEESEKINQLVEQLDESFIRLIEDQTALNHLSDFMVNEALQNLPEIQQIELAIAAQERLLKSNQRSFYLPTIAVGSGYDLNVATINRSAPPPIPGFEVNNEPSWNAAITASIPIFTGGARKYEKEKTEVGLYQLQDQRNDVRNMLELQVRANVELVNASYNNIRLTKSAAEAAEKNIVIVQDLYKSGQVNVVTLVDAQNALLGAQINATNAIYQFMIDYFSLQRSTGHYSFLATEAQRAQFIQEFLNFKTK